MTYSFKTFCVLVALLTLKPADSALKAALRGRLAHMLCMQYELEQNFSTPPPPHRKPLYRAPDAPCRNIHWQECSKCWKLEMWPNFKQSSTFAGSGSCEKFLSVDKYPCEEGKLDSQTIFAVQLFKIIIFTWRIQHPGRWI